MLLRRVAEHLKHQQWTAVFLDFLIVVVGVFIGLQVNNWNASRSDAHRETEYLMALNEDFAKVILELEGDIADYENIANSMTLLIEQSRLDAPDASLAELNTAAGHLITMVGTPIVSDTYANLTGSGDLSLIKNQLIRNALSAFFAETELIELIGNTHEMQLVNIFQPYIVSNLDYTLMFRTDRHLPMSVGTDETRILAVLTTPELRNTAAVKWDISTDIHNVLLSALEDAQAVKALLTEELAHRQ